MRTLILALALVPALALSGTCASRARSAWPTRSTSTSRAR